MGIRPRAATCGAPPSFERSGRRQGLPRAAEAGPGQRSDDPGLGGHDGIGNNEASRDGGRHAEGKGFGLIAFAAVVLAVVGIMNLIEGIAAIARSHVFVANAHYVIGDLRAWGWVTLIFGVLQLLAAGGVMMGNQWARWFGVAVAGIGAITMMFFIPAYPVWALVVIAIEVVALYGLCAYGQPREHHCLLALRGAERPRPRLQYRGHGGRRALGVGPGVRRPP